MPAAPTTFEIGDRVLHATKPEWGVGHIARASAETHEGRPVQRLTVRFERAGVKTLSTAHADLRPAPTEPASDPAAPEGEQASEPVTPERMISIPEPARDPFASPIDRLSQTLALYRFSNQGGSLLDWAAMQSGLADPLTRFSRHDLEDLYDRFNRTLDQHLGDLVVEVKKAVGTSVRAEELQRVIAAAPPAARQALQRVRRTR
ncbi:MAG: DUF3553 domain-containing protein [Phycisphaerales bacterium JB059]